MVEELSVTHHQVLLAQHQLGAGGQAHLLLHLGEAEALEVQLQVGGGSDEGGHRETEEDGVDAGVGSLLSLGITDNSLLIFMTD